MPDISGEPEEILRHAGGRPWRRLCPGHYRDLDAALQSTLAFIATEGIDHAVRCGRFITSPHYEVMAKELGKMKRHLA
jgi:hypothetical protein